MEGIRHFRELELHCGDYREYEHIDGDVVYCDPPYAGVHGYGEPFDSKAFYEWAATRPYDVYVSSYDISDGRLCEIWSTSKRSLYNDKNLMKLVTEKIYCNRPVGVVRQMSMFGCAE